jgi:hypothetical protein
MAEKRTIELEIKDNFKKVEKNTDDLNESLKETEKIVSKTSGVDKFTARLDELDAQIASGNLNTRQMNKLLQEYQTVAAQAGTQTPIGDRAIKSAAGLKDTLTDLQVRTKLLSSDYVKMDTTLAAIGTGAQAFSGIQSAMVLTGVESEELQKTMVKLQAVQGVANSISAVTNALNKDAILGIQARIAIEKIQAAVIGTTTGAMKLLRIALISTGIGALVVAIGLLIANFDKVTAAVMSARERFEKLGTGVKIAISIMFPFIGIIYGITKALEAMGFVDDVKTAKLKKNAEAHTEAVIKSANKRAKAIKKEQTQNDAKAQREIDLAKASGKATYEMELTKAKSHLASGRVFLEVQKSKMKAIKAEMDLLLETEDKDSDRYKELKKRTEAVRKIIDETYKDNVDTKHSIEIMEAQHQKEMADKAKAAGDKAKQTAEQNRKAYIDNLKKQNDDQAKLEELAENQKLALMQDGIDKEKALRQDAFNDYRDNFLKERTQEEQAALDKQYESGKISREQYNKAVEELRLNAESKLTEQERQILVNAKDLLNKDLLAIDEKHQAEVKKRTEDFQKKMQEDEKKRRLDFDMQIEQLQEQNYQESLSEQQREIYLLQEKYAEMQLLAQGNADAEKTIAEAKGRELDAINKKYDEEDKARREAALQRNADLAKSGLSAISDLTELFGKKSEKQAKRAFQIKKAASISSALIDTFLSARSAYYSQFTPVPDPSSPVRGGIAAGIAVASGLIGVAKIASQKFEGGGSVSGGGGAEGGGGGMGGGSQAPSFNVVGNNGINQLAQLQQQPTQAYVVSGQVTTAQSLDRNRVQNATL